MHLESKACSVNTRQISPLLTAAAFIVLVIKDGVFGVAERVERTRESIVTAAAVRELKKEEKL